MHALIRGASLDRFYALGGGRNQRVGRVPVPAPRDWLAPLEQRHRLGDGRVDLSLDVQGIHCAACVWLLQELWRRMAGASRFDLNPSIGRVRMVYDPARVRLGDWVDTVERLGYRTAPAAKRDTPHDRGLLIRLGICVALALNAMMFAFGGYLGMSAADGPAYELFRWLSFALSTAAVLIGGPVFFRAALAGVRNRVLHLDQPISLGILTAWGASAWAFLSGSGESYFDTVSVFVALMLLGRYLQRAAVRRNRNFLLANDGAEHLTARRLGAAGALERVPIASVQPGDRLLLTPGDLVPARARLGEVAAPFSLDWIDGESAPRRFAAGAVVPAGAFLGGRRSVVVEVLATAADSGLLQLLSTPERGPDDLRGRGRFWLLVNRLYVVGVLVVAALAGLVWAFVEPGRAAEVVTAVLVVTCPCAFGLATPLAFDVALATLRRAGVFVRRAALLEKARHVRKIVFDKTGTLTSGGVTVTELRQVPGELRDVLFTMASSSSHPVSRAIADSLAPSGARFLESLEVHEHVGDGLEATLDGVRLRLGRESFALGDRHCAAVGNGGLCELSRDGHVEACFAVDEEFRDGAAAELAALRASGHDVWLVSGDRTAKVERAADRLGLPRARAFGDVRADDKAAFLRQIDSGDTLMVGDGLNDAPAFEAAFCAGTPALDRPVMPARADFFWIGGGAGAVVRLLDTARRFHRVVTANLWLALAYNGVAVSLAVVGAMTPLLCAVLMPLSSLLLIGHTVWRLRAAGVDA